MQGELLLPLYKSLASHHLNITQYVRLWSLTLRKDEFWLTEVKEKLLDNPQIAVMRENKWLIFKLAKQIRDFSGVYKYIVGGEQGLY